MYFRKDVVIIISVVLLTLFVGVYCAGIELGRNQVGELLCYKQQYDFCEVKSISTTTYKIKDSFIKRKEN